ncbi:MAG: hypothetical protein RMX65_011685 [Nostoc sp. DedQUE01]|nr:hypothetical protein [Nostoc sp. DedQUE01]
MSQLDEEQNQNLFYLVNFLNLYYSSNTTNTVRSQEAYKNLMTSYGELIKKIKNDGYKSEVRNKRENIHPEFNLEHIYKIPHHIQMIDNINNLSTYEQKNVVYLVWFILYCKIYKLDINDPNRRYPLWQRYCQLIKQIKDLPIHEVI